MAPAPWIRTDRAAPGPNVPVLGWDSLHGEFHVATWDGVRTDHRGRPLLLPEHVPDVFIEFWTPLPPKPKTRTDS